MGNDPPPTVEYATPSRDPRRGRPAIVALVLIALVLLSAAAGAMFYLLTRRATVTVQVAPAAPATPVPVPPKPPSLKLPSDPLRLTIRQRETRAIPGSSDTILISLRDITRGQVLLSASSGGGGVVIDTTSVREGDAVPFTVKGSGEFVIDVSELHNTLTGEDFAVLTISTPEKRPATTKTSTTAPAP